MEKVDQLINLVGELVITQAMLAQTGKALKELDGRRWYVSGDEALGDCEFHGHADPRSTGIWLDPGSDPRSDLNPGRPGYAPTAPAYGQWSTPAPYQESISVVAGGGR